ncbi:autophagy-related protein 13-domain-containing protein [Limtongia smithiae]|uniref:autophagy-related protein 13-domain-containing protein n=1 Tax=Limtongia smithiae TaxID=1125753 RepID=UPI0034D01BE3
MANAATAAAVGGSSSSGHPGSEHGASAAASARDPASGLAQIVQNMFAKAAHVVLQSRMSASPVYPGGTSSTRSNKWFALDLSEEDTFRDELRIWRTFDAKLLFTGASPSSSAGSSSLKSLPPLLIETVLDTRDLASNQVLVSIGENGKSWSVDAVTAAQGVRSDSRRPEVVLERWKIVLDPAFVSTDDLPIVYKRAIVLFRSLYAYTRLLPAWRFKRKLGKSNLNHVKMSCRVYNGAYTISNRGRVGLKTPLVPDSKADPWQSYEFKNIATPAGRFSIQVTYRTNCDFQVADAESILSTHLQSLDELNLQHNHTAALRQYSRSSRTPPFNYSLPSSQNAIANLDVPDPGMSYGSLTSFHVPIPSRGQSALSTLSSAQSNSVGQGATASSARSIVNTPQSRPGSFIQPFKSPALSASPSLDTLGPSSYPRLTYHRVSSSSSLSGATGTAIAQSASSRGSSSISPGTTRFTIGQAGVIAAAGQSPVSGSPGSGRRFSSSFASRNSVVIHPQQSFTQDSSGPSPSLLRDPTASISRSNTTTASTIAPAVAATGDDAADLQAFMRMLASQPVLNSFSVARRGSSSVTVGNASASVYSTSAGSTGSTTVFPGSASRTSLSRFQLLRESHAVLTDSLTASLSAQQQQQPQHRTNSTSSAGSFKAVSPSTPHTPAIPSRLSEALTADRFRNEAVFEDDDEDDDDDLYSPHEAGTQVPRARDVQHGGLRQRRGINDDASEQRRRSMQLSSSYSSSPAAAAIPRSEDNTSIAGAVITDTAATTSSGRGATPPRGSAIASAGVLDDDELLFAMSDMHSVLGGISSGGLGAGDSSSGGDKSRD